MNVSGEPFPNGISSLGFATLSNVDGLRMENEGSNNTPSMDRFLLESIEIMLGPAGLMEGAGQPGGVVIRVLKRPNDKFTMGGSVSYGSYNFKRSEFEIGRPLVPDQGVRTRFAASDTQRDFFYDTADHGKLAPLGTVEADMTDYDPSPVSGASTRQENAVLGHSIA